MKIKFTHPVPEKGYQAGLEYDLPPQEAQEYLEKDIAIRANEDIPDEKPRKRVKHDDG